MGAPCLKNWYANGLIGDDFDGIFSNKDLCLTAVYWYPCMPTATRLIMPSFFP